MVESLVLILALLILSISAILSYGLSGDSLGKGPLRYSVTLTSWVLVLVIPIGIDQWMGRFEYGRVLFLVSYIVLNLTVPLILGWIVRQVMRMHWNSIFQ